MIKLAIFDLDGTLVDSIDDLADSVNKALADFGYPVHSTGEYRRMVGNGAKKLIERALPEGTSEKIRDRVHAVYSGYYREGCLNKTKPYDGIAEMIASVKAAGIKCAVASNKPDEFSNFIVSRIFDGGLFDLVRGKQDGTPTKPSPDIIYAICKTLGCETDEAVMIGDSNVDVMTAHNAGIRCIGCSWGFRGAEELEKAGADIIVGSANELRDTLLNIV